MKKIHSELETKATASVQAAVKKDLKKEDKPLKDILNDEQHLPSGCNAAAE